MKPDLFVLGWISEPRNCEVSGFGVPCGEGPVLNGGGGGVWTPTRQNGLGWGGGEIRLFLKGGPVTKTRSDESFNGVGDGLDIIGGGGAGGILGEDWVEIGGEVDEELNWDIGGPVTLKREGLLSSTLDIVRS